MEEDEQLIRNFYRYFQNLDWKGMSGCYTEDIFFYDPVFANLEGEEVRAMWEMLLRNAKDLQINCSDIKLDEGYGNCHWIASYTYSSTGRKVVNKGMAYFKFSGGK